MGLPRARLAFIKDSNDVVISGITFKDSQFWNLHLYRSQRVTVDGSRFVVPDDYKQAPSTDGIDVDSCQHVTIENCEFSVTDDCIAMKGSRGPTAYEDESSPPVEHVRVENCTFRRGHAVVTLGSEATVVRDVVVENCRVIGKMTVANLKLRPDTEQHYEDIHYRDITLDNADGKLIAIMPWRQYVDKNGPAPQSTVRNIRISNVKGRFGSFGNIRPNRGQTEIRDIQVDNVDLRLKDDRLQASGTRDLTVTNVTLNGKVWTLSE